MRLAAIHAATAIALAGVLAPLAAARPSIYGGGVIFDRDPTNNVIGGWETFAITGTSIARAGVCSLSPTDDQDYFALTINVPSVLTVITVPLTGPLGGFALSDTSTSIIQNSSGTVFVTSDDAGTDQTGTTDNSFGSVLRASLNAGSYQIRVINVQYVHPGSSYGILASVYTGDGLNFEEWETNNGPAFALNLGLELGGPMVGTGTISPGGDVDFYSVDMRRGQTLAAVTTPVQGLPGALNTPDTLLDVIATNGATVLCTSDEAGTDYPATPARGSAVRFRAPNDGRYFLRVRGYNASTTGKYALTAGLFSPPPGGECPADLNGDGFVNTSDLTIFLSKFGTACP